MIDAYGVSAYIFGHTHNYRENVYYDGLSEGVFYLNVSSLGKADSDHFAVAAVDGAAARIKSRIDDLGIGFDGLSELMADLKTIGAQLSSPRPKTAVIRECLRSVIGVLDAGNGAEESRRLQHPLGE